MLWRSLFLLLISLLPLAAAEPPAPALDVRPVKRWLAMQDKIRTLKADFVQTRAFHSLKDPFVSNGTFWFAAPVSFRIEMGDPPKMVSVRRNDAIFLIQPLKKKAEKFPVDDLSKKSSPAIFKFPIAKDFEDFNRQFELRAVSTEGDRGRIEVAPRDAAMRKLVTWAKFEFDLENGQLYTAEMAFKDGTSMRNEFSNVQFNPKIDPALFEYDLKGFQVTGGRP